MAPSRRAGGRGGWGVPLTTQPQVVILVDLASLRRRRNTLGSKQHVYDHLSVFHQTRRGEACNEGCEGQGERETSRDGAEYCGTAHVLTGQQQQSRTILGWFGGGSSRRVARKRLTLPSQRHPRCSWLVGLVARPWFDFAFAGMSEMAKFCPSLRTVRFHGSKEDRNRIKEVPTEVLNLWTLGWDQWVVAS